MAEVIKTVKNSGGDYTSISAWISGEQRALGANEIAVAEVYNDFPSGLNERPTVAGFTNVNATNYVIIRAAPGQKHTGTLSTGARINATSGSGKVYSSSISFTRLINMEVQSNNTGALLRCDGGNNLWFEGLICDATSAAAKSVLITNNTSGHIFRRCFISHTVTSSTDSCVNIDTGVSNIELSQCDFGGTVEIEATSTNTLVQNCCVAKSDPLNAGWLVVGTIASGSGNNAAYNGATITPPGSNPITQNIVDGVDYVDAANNNYRKPTGSKLIKSGKSLTSTIPNDVIDLPFNPSYEIGSFSFPPKTASYSVRGRQGISTVVFKGLSSTLILSLSGDTIEQGAITLGGSLNLGLTGALVQASNVDFSGLSLLECVGGTEQSVLKSLFSSSSLDLVGDITQDNTLDLGAELSLALSGSIQQSVLRDLYGNSVLDLTGDLIGIGSKDFFTDLVLSQTGDLQNTATISANVVSAFHTIAGTGNITNTAQVDFSGELPLGLSGDLINSSIADLNGELTLNGSLDNLNISLRDLYASSSLSSIGDIANAGVITLGAAITLGLKGATVGSVISDLNATSELDLSGIIEQNSNGSILFTDLTLDALGEVVQDGSLTLVVDSVLSLSGILDTQSRPVLLIAGELSPKGRLVLIKR